MSDARLCATAAAASGHLQHPVHAVLEHHGEVGPGVLEQGAAQGRVGGIGRVFQIPDLEHAAARPGDRAQQAH